MSQTSKTKTKINFKLTKREKNRIVDLASYFNLTISQYLRTVALNPDTLFLIDKEGSIAEIKSSLKRWGNNLNQLVRVIHQDKLANRNIIINSETEKLIMMFKEELDTQILHFNRQLEGVVVVTPQPNPDAKILQGSSFTFSNQA